MDHPLGLLLAGACRDRSVLARLGGAIGDTARRAATELASAGQRSTREQRARTMASWRAPVVAGLREIDPSWIEAGLAALPPRARAALSSGPRGPVDVWLARLACAELAWLPAIDDPPTRPRSIADVIGWPGELVRRWLGEVGADQLAHATASVPLGQLVAPEYRGRIATARARIVARQYAAELGPARAAISRCQDLVTREIGPARADLILTWIGARAVAPWTDALVSRQITLRMPRAVGLPIRHELARHAYAPRTEAPSWFGLAQAW